LPEFELVKNAIPTFARVLREETDNETLTYAAWALS